MYARPRGPVHWCGDSRVYALQVTGVTGLMARQFAAPGDPHPTSTSVRNIGASILYEISGWSVPSHGLYRARSGELAGESHYARLLVGGRHQLRRRYACGPRLLLPRCYRARRDNRGLRGGVVCAHMMVYPLVHDLLAETDAERGRAIRLIRDTVQYITENGYYLVDSTGNKTRYRSPAAALLQASFLSSVFACAVVCSCMCVVLVPTSNGERLVCVGEADGECGLPKC